MPFSNLERSIVSESKPEGFLASNEFLIRRLHSLSGLIPVGAYMCVHLLTNASVMSGAAAFQRNVNMIHSLDKALPVIEWAFIFIPILFHAIFGFVIIGGGLQNTSSYPLQKNWRYTLQRWTGGIAFLFIVGHVFHLHGWVHSLAEPLGGANFKAYNATSSLSWALRGAVPIAFYSVGIIACVYHLANGIWTMGITWGVWTSPTAQKRADKVCIGFGFALLFVGITALYGAVTTDIKAAFEVEQQMLEQQVGEIPHYKHYTEEERQEIEDKLDESSEGVATAASH